MKFKTEFLIDELGLPWSAIETQFYNKSRWHTNYTIVFECESKFYRTWYSEGNTEYQEIEPWEGKLEVCCEEVKQVEKIVKVWEPV